MFDAFEKMANFLEKLYKEHDLILVYRHETRGAGSHLNAKYCLFICTLYQVTFIHDQVLFRTE